MRNIINMPNSLTLQDFVKVLQAYTLSQCFHNALQNWAKAVLKIWRGIWKSLWKEQVRREHYQISEENMNGIKQFSVPQV